MSASSMPGREHPPRRRSGRRWFQFRLSTLLIVTAVVAVLVAWKRERLSRWVESLWPVQPAGPLKDARDPRQIVLDFLELGRSGKPDEAEQLLSPAAKEVFHRLQLRAELPSSERVGYEVSTAELLGEEARVKMTWTVIGAHYDVRQLEFTGILRQHAEGWRITGVIVPRSEGITDFAFFISETQGNTLTLNFEDERSVRNFFNMQ